MPGASWPSSSHSGNPMLDMGVQMLGQQMMPPGMQLGQWQPSQNLLDTQMARQFAQGQLGAAMAMGTGGAAQHFQEMISGRPGSQGGGLVGMGLLSQQQGQQMSGMAQGADFGRIMGGAMPWLGMAMPGGAMDEMGLGSMQAASNYAGLFRGQMGIPGQPGTGMTAGQLQGMTTGITGGLHQDLFSGAKFGATRGIGEGQMSGLVGAAQQMGRGPGDFGAMSRQQRAGYVSGLSQPASAIRDLGGEYANLSPQQTLQTLNMVSMGGFSGGVGNEQLEQQTRMFKQLSQSAQISLGEGMGLQQLAGARSAQLGGEMTSGVMAGQHGMAFGAYAKGRGGLPAASGASVNEMMQQDAILTAQAGRSETGNLAASLMRMGETGMLKEGTQAHKMFTDLKDKGEFSAMYAGQFRSMLKRSGVDMGAASMIMQQRGQNLEMYGDRIAGAVRETQWDADVGSFMQRMVAGQLGRGSRKRGWRMSPQQSMALGKTVTDTIREMAGKPPEEVRAAIAKKFEGMGAGEDEALAAAETALGAAGEAARRQGYRGYGHAAALHSREAMRAIRDQETEAEARTARAIELAPEAQKGVLGRIMDAAKGGTQSGSRFLAKLLGGEEIDEGAVRGDLAAEQAEDQEQDADANQVTSDTVTISAIITNLLQTLLDENDTASGASDGVSEQPMDSGSSG